MGADRVNDCVPRALGSMRDILMVENVFAIVDRDVAKRTVVHSF